MKKYITFVIILYSNCLFCQNFILNYSFENSRPNHSPEIYEGTPEYSSAKNFDKNIANWKGRMPNNIRYPLYDLIWHSPDWYFDTNPKHIAIRSYEVVQQELSADLISGAYYRVKFKYRWQNYSNNVNLEFYLSQNELKYKKEILFFWQNEENHLCSEDYKNFTATEETDFFIVANIDNLINLSDVTNEWYNYEEIIQVPLNGTMDWFGFQLVLKPEYAGEGCVIGYLHIDDVELELLSCSDDPCSPTDGDINIQSFTHPEYGHCFCNLTNVSKISNFKVYNNVLGQSPIYTGIDVECLNGIEDTICWNGRNNFNAPVAPALYFIKFEATNDCGTFEQNYSLIHPQGTNYITKTPYLCNNSIELPIDCCGHEPDIYIYDEVFTGVGYADLIAMNSITAENITVEHSVDLVYFQAGNIIEITDAIIDGNFIAEIKPCEPYYNQAYNSKSQSLISNDNMGFQENGFIENKTEDLDKKHEFQIYPNPAENMLYVISDNGGRVNFAIYDINGKKRNSGIGYNTINIDISDLCSGIYVLSISDNYQIYNYKFSKK